MFGKDYIMLYAMFQELANVFTDTYLAVLAAEFSVIYSKNIHSTSALWKSSKRVLY